MMQTGQDKFGMQTFNQSLASLYFKKQITLEMATARSSNADELQDLINRGAVALQTPAPRAPGYPAQGAKPQAPLGRVGR
jgi:twitching motility protein PilT